MQRTLPVNAVKIECLGLGTWYDVGFAGIVYHPIYRLIKRWYANGYICLDVTLGMPAKGMYRADFCQGLI